jgi:pimeloyl-ACP methyl ester carboxylesterase
MLLGLAAAAAVSGLPAQAIASETKTIPTTTPFKVRSSDGTMLAGDAQGDPAGPEILFVHGLRQSRLSWNKQFNDPSLAGLRMVRFDLRGHGDSDKPASPEAYGNLDLWADDLAAVIDGAKLRRPVLVGWSLGGWVVGGYLRRYPNGKIAGLNLVDAVVKFSPDLLTPLASAFAKSASSQDFAERNAATADFLLACFHTPPSGLDLALMMVVNGMTPAAVNTGLMTSGSPDLDPTFQAFRGAVLLTHGAHDRLVRLEMSQHVVSLQPGARLSMYANSGHCPFYEEAPRFGRELAAFASIANRNGE